MRILWCVRKYMDVSLDSGTWTGMVRTLSDAGHEVELLTGYRHGRRGFGLEGRIKYVPSVKLPVLNALTFLGWAAFSIPSRARAIKAQVVLVDPSTIWSALPYVAWCRLRQGGPSFVLDVRTLPVDTGRPLRDRIVSALFRCALRAAGLTCHGMTAITRPMASVVGSLAGVDTAHIGIWTSGVETEVFDPAGCVAARSSQFTVMYHGGLLASRGLPQAVEAMQQLKRDGVSGIRLRIVGSGKDSTSLTDLVSSLDVLDVVSVEPPVDPEDVPELICGASVGLLPFPDLECWRVSSPLKLMEYLAMQKPVIATRLACNEDVVGRSRCVVWAESSSPADLASAMLDAMVRREELEAAARDEARDIVVEGFTWRMQSERLAAYLDSVRRPLGS